MPRTTNLPPLPHRPDDAHKGIFGHVLVVAGSRGMTGAAALTALSSLRSGAGLVTIASPEPLLPLIVPAVPEATHLPLTADPQRLAPADAPGILAHLDARSTVLAIGPGLGREDGTAETVRDILSKSPRPAVLDADGIFAFNGEPGALKAVPAAVILTPHPGEMAALLGKTTAAVQNDREAAVLEAAERTGKVVVLKGHGTLVADGGQLYENQTGGPALAKGGSGDVLTGMAAAFLAQGMEPFDAAVLAVYLHGLAGDLAARALGTHSVLSRDVVENIPKAFLQHGG